jgi:putative flavoprotein involved in K+ transport
VDRVPGYAGHCQVNPRYGLALAGFTRNAVNQGDLILHEAQIVIVGGGASGLTSAGALKHQGLNPVVLDRDKALGGTWARRYDRLHLHTIRALSHMAYYGIPKAYPRYPSRDQFVQYIKDYAAHFELDVRLNCAVNHIRAEGNSQHPTWVAETDEDEWHSTVLVIATGYNNVPNVPDWPGQAAYQGRFVVAMGYKTGRDFAGQRVLVIGSGNTGTEICVDLVEQGAAFVANSIRTPPMIVPRDPFGLPIHGLAIPVSFLPTAAADWVARMVARLHLGDLTRYGMQKPAWQIFKDKRIPLIDVGYVDLLKAGKIHIRSNVAAFTASGVRYENGETEAFDTVIAATGYRTGLEKLIDLPHLLDENGVPLVRSGEPTPYPGLYFVGLENSPAGILMAARIASRKMAKHVADFLAPPGDKSSPASSEPVP